MWFLDKMKNISTIEQDISQKDLTDETIKKLKNMVFLIRPFQAIRILISKKLMKKLKPWDLFRL